ncbi:MAG: pentapeptide repeat-containing protein [Candidatus Omnitrophica bacterium]|nr:pentapeptide repeat-containing protein [Candidatus Omnitrophota bacterium]
MKCKFDKCKNSSITNSDFCWNHLHDKETYKKDLLDRIDRGEDLSGYNLQKVSFKDAHLEKANFSKANLSQSDFSGSHIFNSIFENADLIGADFTDSDVTHCDLKGTDITKSRFVNARLWNSNLSDSNMTECDMSGADFWNTRLFNVKIWHTTFAAAKSLNQRNFSSEKKLMPAPRINETGLFSAQESYRDLKGYFLAGGMYDDASWASFKEKSLERLILLKNRDIAYFPSLLMNILCGYGEKPYRIVLSAIVSILFFAIMFFTFNTVENPANPGYSMNWADYLYYSAITFTTVGYGDFIPRPIPIFRLLAACEGFIGVFLTGLFVFTLARRYSAR